MSDELLVRGVYGGSLIVHNFFASVPLGIALIHCFYSFRQYFSKNAAPELLLRLTFDTLVISILLSILSGFAFEIEFRRFWDIFNNSLQQFDHHIGHKSAVISFFVSSALIISTYKFRLWEKPLVYLILSIGWVILAWLFSGWSIFLNTIMQHPYDAVVENGILILNGSIADRFFSDYHIFRQLHIAAASLLKASLIVFLIWIYCSKNFTDSNRKFIAYAILISLLLLAVSGHFQALKISEIQPSKFSAMEGISTTDDNLNPLEFLVFASFRIMVFSVPILFVLILIFGFLRKKISLAVWVTMFLITELAVNAGWIVSESGRQPWTYYGLLKREITPVLPYLNFSVAALILNTFLLFTGTVLSIRFLKRNFETYSPGN
jgi:cytochrome bd-type quinol oxidase subunit 1